MMRGSNGNSEKSSLEVELEILMLRAQRNRGAIGPARDLNMHRSGSAPPTFEGSSTAVGSLFGNPNFAQIDNTKGSNNNSSSSGISSSARGVVLMEEEIRSHPAYLSYYYSLENLNPRLPPPLISKEDWRVAQRFQSSGSSFGGIGDLRKNLVDDTGGSLFSMQPGIPAKREDELLGLRKAAARNMSRKNSSEFLDRGSDGLVVGPRVGMGTRKNSTEFLDRGSDGLILGMGMRKNSAEFLDKGSDGLIVGPRGMRKNSVEFLDRSSDGLLVAQRAGMGMRKNSAEFLDRGSEGLLAPRAGMGMRKNSAEFLDRGSDGLMVAPRLGMGMRRKSFADILQEGLERPASLSGRLSRPTKSNSFSELADARKASSSHSAELRNGPASSKGLRPGTVLAGPPGFQNPGSAVPHSLASAMGSSLPRGKTPETHMAGRYPTLGWVPVGSRISLSHSSSMTELADVAASLSGLSLSKHEEDSLIQPQPPKRFDKQSTNIFDMSNGYIQSLQQQFAEKSRAEKLAHASNYVNLLNETGPVIDLNAVIPGLNEQANFPRRTSSLGNLQSMHYQADNYPRVYSTGQKLKSVVNNQLNTAATTSGTGNVLNPGSSNQGGFELLSAVMDPRYIQYPQQSMHAAPFAYPSHSGPSIGRGELQNLQKAYLATLAQQKQQYESSLLGKSGNLNHQYYGNPSFGPAMAYHGNPVANSALSVGCGSPMFQIDRISKSTSMMRSPTGGSSASRHPETGIKLEGIFAASPLEEIKNNKFRSFELSDVVDHVIEFSMDQYGSRFIQQKLETATSEEKKKIFLEIIPHARSLITDVFGNYVIQKFFEHGTESERKELANQLIGHVLPLSLQMYGCRVIQKAVEMVDVDQQTKMVAELDGSVMKCVRDQNGNHVIQKCIECVPQDRIQFIVSSFFGEVVSLSSHPYGCRVIQRVLEHCDDPNTQQIIMDEIMNSVCTLAQDQYGNYVIQHVLQHGKPKERSIIIEKLAGQIVKMSQQKFASNVVEKCLTFGVPEERQLLVNEMLGSTDENEPLQAMMKDPFGNYVVQKVIETCNDHSRELILSRIKVHLNALKRYTYGKHIVSRVEKLITAGEKHMASSSSRPS